MTSLSFFQSQLLSDLSVVLTLSLVHFLWQGVLIAGLAYVAHRGLGRRSAEAGYWCHVLALALMLGALPLTLAVMMQDVHPTSHDLNSASGAGLLFPVDPLVDSFVGESSSEHLQDAGAAWEPAGRYASWLELIAPMAVAIYLAGVMVMVTRLVFSFVGVYRLRAAAASIRDTEIVSMLERLREQLRLRMSIGVATCERIAVPVVVGVLRPMILLPSSVVTGLTPRELEAVLLHELAHVRRGDLLVNSLQRFAEAVLFFHPAVWYVSRAISRERENCCDDIVLAAGYERTDYAGILVRLAEKCVGSKPDKQRVQAALAATGDNPSELKRRVMRLLGASEPIRTDRFAAILMVACSVVLVASALRLHAADGGEKDDESSVVLLLDDEGITTLNFWQEKVEEASDAVDSTKDASPAKKNEESADEEDPTDQVRVEKVADDVIIFRGRKKAVDAVIDVIEKTKDEPKKIEPAKQRRARVLRVDSKTKASDLAKLLELIMGNGNGDAPTDVIIEVDEDGSQLVISSSDDEFRQMEDLVEWFETGKKRERADQALPEADDAAEKKRLVVIPLRTVDAKQVVAVIQHLLPENGLRIDADVRTNRLLAYGSPEQLSKIATVVEQIDGSTPQLGRIGAKPASVNAGFDRLLGVTTQPLNETLRLQLGLPAKRGRVVTKVVDGGAADIAKLKVHDVIVAVNDQPYPSDDVLQRVSKSLERGTLEIIREGRRMEINVQPPRRHPIRIPGNPKNLEVTGTFSIGIAIDQIDETLRRQLQQEGKVGVVVTHVAADSPAAKAGILKHDVIVSVNGFPVGVERLVSMVRRGKPVELALYRAGRKMVVELTPVRAPQEWLREYGGYLRFPPSVEEGMMHDSAAPMQRLR